jgi:hypothetical protein
VALSCGTASCSSSSIASGKEFPTPFSTVQCPFPKLDQIALARAGGARNVRVHYPGVDQPLWGLLIFCQLPDDYQGPAARSYQLEIPESFVKDTDGGRISVVHETITYKSMQSYPAWILWLSRSQLPR